MKNFVEKICKEKQLVCLYKEVKNTEKFFLGIVQKVVYDKLLFESVDLEGNSDGFMVINIDDIFLIEIDNIYIKNIKDKLRETIQDVLVDFKYNGSDLLEGFIHYVFEKEKMVEVELLNSSAVDIRGKVINIENKNIEVEAIDDNGDYDGKSYCRIKDITMIHCEIM